MVAHPQASSFVFIIFSCFQAYTLMHLPGRREVGLWNRGICNLRCNEVRQFLLLVIVLLLGTFIKGILLQIYCQVSGSFSNRPCNFHFYCDVIKLSNAKFAIWGHIHMVQEKRLQFWYSYKILPAKEVGLGTVPW